MRAIADVQKAGHGRVAAVAATVVLSAGVLHASSLTISPEAARVGAYGLALRIDDPATAPPTATWVGIGPEKGLNAEIALLGRFWIGAEPGRSAPKNDDEDSSSCLIKLVRLNNVPHGKIMILKQFNGREVACQGYAVQFTVPVDNPVDNVRLIQRTSKVHLRSPD